MIAVDEQSVGPVHCLFQGKQGNHPVAFGGFPKQKAHTQSDDRFDWFHPCFCSPQPPIHTAKGQADMHRRAFHRPRLKPRMLGKRFEVGPRRTMVVTYQVRTPQGHPPKSVARSRYMPKNLAYVYGCLRECRTSEKDNVPKCGLSRTCCCFCPGLNSVRRLL